MPIVSKPNLPALTAGIILVFAGLTASCSDNSGSAIEVEPEEIDFSTMGPATLSIIGLPEGAKVVTLAWFPGKKDDDPQGIIYPYSDGMTLPAGRLLFLIECEGYEPLMARRIPAIGHTVLEAKMCELDSGCYGTLKVKEPI